MLNDIENLDCEQSYLLNKRGWFLATYYQCKKDAGTCESLERTNAKASSIDRKIGIRIVEKEEHVVFEVWDYWK